MNRWKIFSGMVALSIYLMLIFLFLYFYNIHKTKAKNYVKNSSNRVTVTLVNSDKTVFNKRSKISTDNRPKHTVVPLIHHLKHPTNNHTPKEVIHKKHIPKKVTPKRVLHKKVINKKHTPKKVATKKVVYKKHIPKRHTHTAKKVVPKKVVPKKHTAKKVVPKKVVPKKHTPKKVVPKKVVPKKHTPKKVVPKKVVPKKHTPKKVVPKKVVPKKHTPKKVVPKKVVPKKTAKDLFSSVKTNNVPNRPRTRRESSYIKHRVVPKSAIKHTSSASDRIRNTHLTGRVSNSNRDRGIKSAYIARIKNHMNNWNANSAYKGKRVSLSLTIYNSGRFSYKILSGGDINMKHSLSQFLDRLNRMGQISKHTKSTPYIVKVNFIVR